MICQPLLSTNLWFAKDWWHSGIEGKWMLNRDMPKRRPKISLCEASWLSKRIPLESILPLDVVPSSSSSSRYLLFIMETEMWCTVFWYITCTRSEAIIGKCLCRCVGENSPKGHKNYLRLGWLKSDTVFTKPSHISARSTFHGCFEVVLLSGKPGLPLEGSDW